MRKASISVLSYIMLTLFYLKIRNYSYSLFVVLIKKWRGHLFSIVVKGGGGGGILKMCSRGWG